MSAEHASPPTPGALSRRRCRRPRDDSRRLRRYAALRRSVGPLPAPAARDPATSPPPALPHRCGPRLRGRPGRRRTGIRAEPSAPTRAGWPAAPVSRSAPARPVAPPRASQGQREFGQDGFDFRIRRRLIGLEQAEGGLMLPVGKPRAGVVDRGLQPRGFLECRERCLDGRLDFFAQRSRSRGSARDRHRVTRGEARESDCRLIRSGVTRQPRGRRLRAEGARPLLPLRALRWPVEDARRAQRHRHAAGQCGSRQRESVRGGNEVAMLAMRGRVASCCSPSASSPRRLLFRERPWPDRAGFGCTHALIVGRESGGCLQQVPCPHQSFCASRLSKSRSPLLYLGVQSGGRLGFGHVLRQTPKPRQHRRRPRAACRAAAGPHPAGGFAARCVRP